MPIPTRRRGARPDAQALDELGQSPAAAGRLRKAPAGNPVLDAGSAGPAAEPCGPGESASRPAAAARVAPAVDVDRGQSQGRLLPGPRRHRRARAAYDWTRPHEGHRSFSDFIAAPVMREVARLEAKHHDGQPWPAVEPGQLPTGKPLGSRRRTLGSTRPSP